MKGEKKLNWKQQTQNKTNSRTEWREEKKIIIIIITRTKQNWTEKLNGNEYVQLNWLSLSDWRNGLKSM